MIEEIESSIKSFFHTFSLEEQSILIEVERILYSEYFQYHFYDKYQRARLVVCKENPDHWSPEATYYAMILSKDDSYYFLGPTLKKGDEILIKNNNDLLDCLEQFRQFCQILTKDELLIKDILE